MLTPVISVAMHVNLHFIPRETTALPPSVMIVSPPPPPYISTHATQLPSVEKDAK